MKTSDEIPEDQPPSKSQKKRDMYALKDLAERLAELSPGYLAKVESEHIREAVVAARKITKGNARKRQFQFIAKLLSKIDVEPIQTLVDSLDASSAVYTQKFHELETWRERLINEDEDALSEILDRYPKTDRQQLRHLIRQAIQEREKGDQTANFRKLFQFLKSLSPETAP